MSRRIVPIGPRNARIALVGEAAGQSEEEQGVPFCGSAGQFLTSLLTTAGIRRSDCYITNVFMERPPNNKIDSWCLGKREAQLALEAAWQEEQALQTQHEMGARDLLDELLALPLAKSPKYTHAPLRQGKYIHPRWLFELDRLKTELEAVKPNVIIALGSVACWALLGQSGINKFRGTAIESTLCPGLKVIPTYHPAAILRQYDLRPITIFDLIKAERESHFPHIVRPKREIWTEPTLEDLWTFKMRYIKPDSMLATDIETAQGQITCIGFAPDKSHALVVPFWDKTKPGWSYWPTKEAETTARKFVQHLLIGPWPKLFHNGVYDMQYIWRAEGMRLHNVEHDTMFLHHSLQPEVQKSLGFLGSVNCNEQSWKIMRKRGDKEEKRDE